MHALCLNVKEQPEFTGESLALYSVSLDRNDCSVQEGGVTAGDGSNNWP